MAFGSLWVSRFAVIVPDRWLGRENAALRHRLKKPLSEVSQGLIGGVAVFTPAAPCLNDVAGLIDRV